ncbi:alanine racemase [Neorhizobium galegae]|uniref:alanine racemase n=1 Tax=Neorhizobium galegae TaxID=399 RepID=UPI001AE30AA4|nr:alanine racemase [Neorhizobium galegae]
MDMSHSITWEKAGAPGILTIDLSALKRNYRRIATTVSPAKAAAVVKADAYGLGAQVVAPALYAEGCRDFFVAQYAEAVILRPLLPRDAALYVLNGLQPGTEEDCAARGIVPVLNSLEQVMRWRAAAGLVGERLKALLQFDTGMSRLGMASVEAEALAIDPALLSGIDILYIMSHLACADEAEDPHNASQAEMMRRFSSIFPGVPVCFGNSAGAFLGESYRGALVRPGIALYGARPTDILERPMEPVVTIEARVIQARTVPAGTAVGYSATYVTDSERTLATVALGYADGLPRTLSNRGALFFKGHRLPIVGRVSMDSTIIDISDLEPGMLALGSLVEFIGQHQTLEEVAETAGTISWEILTGLGHRYFRQYR